jgi:hypothetical protein
MTRREKVLTTTLLSLLLVFGGGVLLHMFVYEPIASVRSQLMLAREQYAKKQSELSEEQRQIDGTLRINPRLSQWQKLSLPPRDPVARKQIGVSPEEQKRKHLARMQVDYESYLSGRMRENGFRSDSIDISLRPPDRRTTLATPKGKMPTYERLAFLVKGKATLDNATRMLRDFHKAPLLHQVRSVTMTLPTATTTGGGGGIGRGRQSSDGILDIIMTVEALLVTGAEERTSMNPSTLAYTPRVLAEPTRDYTQLGKRNMFTGIAPTPEPPAPVTEERAAVLRLVKLTTIFFNPDRKRWEASIYDQAAGPQKVEDTEDGVTKVRLVWEKHLNTRILNEIKIQDRYKNSVLDAKVVLIDEKQVIFESEKKFYRLRCGEALHPAIEKPLSGAEVKELGLEASE